MTASRSGTPFRQGLAIVLALAVAGYVGFLLYSQYHAQAELHRLTLSRFVGENDKRVLAADNFLADRMNDLSQLAENRDLALYYENKALGMTMEYGLGASLAVAEDTFRTFRKRKKIQEQELFSRIVYLDAQGPKMLDLKGEGKPAAKDTSWRAYLRPNQRKPHFMFEQTGPVGSIVVSHPVNFKGQYVGQLLAWIPLELIYDHYLAPAGKSSTFITALSMENRYILLPKDTERLLPKQQLPEPKLIRDKTPYSFALEQETNDETRILATYNPIEQTPFAVITFYQDVSGSTASQPRTMLYALLGVGLLLLGGGVSFMRTSVLNTALQVRLEESTLREQLISEKNEKLRQLNAAVEQSASAIIITNVNGVIEYVNPYFTRLTGYSADEAIGQTPRILKASDQDPKVYAELWGTINQGKIWSGELYNKTKDGRLFWEQATIAPVKNDDGVITHFIAVKEDITERKAAEEELRRAKNAAEAASQAKSAFLANMSHEIRTPMNGVIGMTDLCLETDLSREQRTYLDAVKSSADNLLSIINDILDFSKIEAGKVELVSEPFLLRTTIGQALRSIAVKAVEKGLEIVFDPAPDTPDALQGDPGRLRQVLLNLTGNAVKFTETGQITVTIRKREDRPGGKVLLAFSVTDKGIGITPEQQQRIFAPFEQADISTTKSFGGTGLGLSISRRLVELMGGEISVESAPGAGSTFTFTACFGIAELPDYRCDELHGKRVLVVDDVAVNRSMLVGFLTYWGMETVQAAASSEAIELMRTASGHFDFALLDGHMPEENGWQLAARIRAEHAFDQTALIIMPSVGLRGDANRCRELGIAGYLVKPVVHSELYELLRMVLGLPPLNDGRMPVTAHTIAESRSRLRILATDDVPVNRELIRTILEKHGHRVTLAATGQEALDCWRSSSFDLLLMDVQMPVMDGLTATRAIRSEEEQRGGHVPIIAMTAYAMSGDRERCLEAGMDDYIAKPINPVELLTTIVRQTGNAVGLPDEPAQEQTSVASSPPDSVEPPIYDREALLQRLGGNEELIPRFLAMFRKGTDNSLEALRQTIADGDMEGIRLHAHTIKGAAANIGAMRLRETALAMEKANVDPGSADLDQLLQTIIDAYNEFMQVSEA